MLAIGAVAILAAERFGTKQRSDESLTLTEAFWIGCAQAAALVPGVSRSGATLAVALLFGLARPAAARFIFLLGIPAIVAAAGKEAPHIVSAGLHGDTAILFAIGIVSSAVVGFLTVKYFVRFLGGHFLNAFAWYRFALAALVVIWLV